MQQVISRRPETCIDQTVQLSMVVSAPCAMGLAVLAQPIVFLLYGNSTGLAANLLILGSFSILLNGMSNISNGVLQAIGQQRIPVITAAIALVVDIIVVVVLLFTTNLGVYALLIAMVIYSVVVCVLNDLAMKKYLQYKNPWKQGYLYPILCFHSNGNRCRMYLLWTEHLCEIQLHLSAGIYSDRGSGLSVYLSDHQQTVRERAEKNSGWKLSCENCRETSVLAEYVGNKT